MMKNPGKIELQCGFWTTTIFGAVCEIQEYNQIGPSISEAKGLVISICIYILDSLLVGYGILAQEAVKYDENYVCNNSSKIIRFGKKLIHSLFCIIRVCSEKKESSILLGPKIVLYYYKHFFEFWNMLLLLRPAKQWKTGKDLVMLWT